MKIRERLRLSKEGKSVIADLFVEIAAFSLLSIPGYVMVLDWARLTTTIVFFILFVRIAIQIRKKIL